ncbi:MAG: hypothetical protein KDA84_23215 [Planctomycetaceae bacterium]|nr:hypothetical protein [Planctomycetaceae bacterium]
MRASFARMFIMFRLCSSPIFPLRIWCSKLHREVLLIQQRNSFDSTCILNAYTPAWQMGTGVPTSLAPGAYQITREFQLAGITYWDLNNTFRVDSRRVRDANTGG